MFEPLRTLLNVVFFNSPYIFEDGSRISYHAQFDILRYETRDGAAKVLDIALTYDPNSKLFRINCVELWKWRDPSIPLNTANESGPILTESERRDILHKLRIFQAKDRTKYEPVLPE
jgi:hypothetical protein